MKVLFKYYILAVLFFQIGLFPYTVYSYEKSPDLNLKDSSLYLIVDNTNFLKNAEYFNPFVDGYSDLGFNISTAIKYSFSKKLNLIGGLHLLKYSGESDFSSIEPIFSVDYQVNSKLSLRMGTLDKVKIGDISDVIYFNDFYWKDKIENGLMLRYYSNIFSGDLWIDWENHIIKSSYEQERFLFGLSGSFTMLRDSRTYIDFPTTLLVTHVGGQINDSDEDLISIANSSVGIEVNHLVNFKKSSSIIFKYKLFNYFDLSQHKNSLFSKGFGHLIQLNYKLKYLHLYSGYFYGYHFISSKGNPIYMSVSERYNNYSRPIRKLVNSGLEYIYHINSSSNIYLDLTTHFDPQRLDLDYSFLIKINVNLSHLLK